MTKQEFFNILNNLENAGQHEIDLLEEVLQQHSYFQTAPVLQAKIATKINSADKASLITKAALYTTDRANLKNFIEDRIILAQPVIEEKKEQEFIPVETEQVTAEDIQKIVADIQKPAEPSSSDELYKEVMKNLETLKSLRKKYEFLEDKEKEDQESQQEEELMSPLPEHTSGKSENKEKKSTKPPAKKKTKKENTQPEEIIEPPEEPLSKIDLDEQNNLIEIFIKNESQFSKKKPDINNENKDDLSERSTTISDEIISENLAEIMLNQGKTEKAVEIYKKLIWKFPQKKAYFASRIEELNNK